MVEKISPRADKMDIYFRLNSFTLQFTLLRARRNEKEFKVKPATSFIYFQYLLTENLKQSSRQKIYYLTVP